MKHNNPTLCALRRLHADIGGKISYNRKHAKRLREDRKHVAAVMRMFSPDYDVKGIPARRTEAGITMKLKRGTFAATFFLACLAAMELEGVVLEEI